MHRWTAGTANRGTQQNPYSGIPQRYADSRVARPAALGNTVLNNTATGTQATRKGSAANHNTTTHYYHLKNSKRKSNDKQSSNGNRKRKKSLSVDFEGLQISLRSEKENNARNGLSYFHTGDAETGGGFTFISTDNGSNPSAVSLPPHPPPGPLPPTSVPYDDGSRCQDPAAPPWPPSTPEKQKQIHGGLGDDEGAVACNTGAFYTGPINTSMWSPSNVFEAHSNNHNSSGAFLYFSPQLFTKETGPFHHCQSGTSGSEKLSFQSPPPPGFLDPNTLHLSFSNESTAGDGVGGFPFPAGYGAY